MTTGTTQTATVRPLEALNNHLPFDLAAAAVRTGFVNPSVSAVEEEDGPSRPLPSDFSGESAHIGRRSSGPPTQLGGAY